MQKKQSVRRGKSLHIEPLDPRIVLSAAPWTNAEFSDFAANLQMDVVEERTTFRNLAVPTGATPETVEAASRTFLESFHANLGLPQDASSQLQTVEVKHGLAGSHVRFEQVVGGIKVHDSFVSVHTDGHGVIQAVHNNFKPVDAARTQPAISVEDAIKAAEKHSGVSDPWFDAKSELVIVPQKDDGQLLAWEVTVYGLDDHGHAGDFNTLVDAQSGSVLEVRNLAAHATGTGDVFEPNPYQTQGSGSSLSDSNDSNSTALENQMVSVTLQGLDEGTGFLEGEYVDVTLTGGLYSNFANESNRIYEYTRDDNHFEEVVIYHAVDSIQRYFHSLGFDDDAGTPNGIRDFPTMASAHWYTADNSFYSTGNDAIHFGDGGVDDGEDADIIAHEYGHAVQHDQNSNWGGGEMGAMGEAFGDYLAASFYANIGHAGFQNSHAAAVGEWDATSYSSANPPNLRRVDTNNVWPNDLSGGVHNDGQIWSSALWNIRGQLGGITTDTLVLEHHFGLPSGATMRDAAEHMIQVDANLNGGANETVLRDEFEARGILGELAEDDHGNSAGLATVTAAVSTNTGTIEFPGNDTDWFAFTVPAGANVTLSTDPNGGSLNDTTLRLYNTNGTSELEFDDDDGPGLYSLINFTATSAGTYYVAVGSYSTNTGSYTLDIESDAVDIAGDFNGDGTHDCLDINALTNEIAAGTHGSIYEMTGDSFVDASDLDAWRSVAGEALFGTGGTLAVGDANLDGTVDGADFEAWSQNKFTNNANWCDGDFDADGAIGGRDFLLWNANRTPVALASPNRVPQAAPEALSSIRSQAEPLAANEQAKQSQVVPATVKFNVPVVATNRGVRQAAVESTSDRDADRTTMLDQLFANDDAYPFG